MENLQERFQEAVQSFWDARARQQQKQVEGGRIDAGTRGAVTGGSQMGALEVLIVDLLEEAGLDRLDVKIGAGLELPGYYRPEKKWDLLVVSEGELVTAIEFKSHVGPSFGNNFNNRVEEALGNSTDIWTAFREQRLGSIRPLIGYFLLLEDTERVHLPVKAAEPYYPVDPVFLSASYAQRYGVFCQRLVLERNYDCVCLTLATRAAPTVVSHPTNELGFGQFVATLQGHAHSHLLNRTAEGL